MRKSFTLLFAALLACVGVVKAEVTDLPQITTDLENPIYYTIYNTRSNEPGGLIYYAGDNVGLKDTRTSLSLEDKFQFFFTGSHEAMYIHNKATGNKLASVDSWTEDGAEWAMGVSPKGGGLAIGPKGGLNGNECWNDKNYSTNESTSDFTTWSANDAGSIFVVELAANYVFPISDLFYVIECPLFEKVQGEAGKKAIYVNDEGKAVWGSEDLTNHNFYWIPTVDAENGTVAFKNLGTGHYLKDASGNMLSTDTTEVIPTATLKILGDCSFNINISGTLHAAGHDSGKGASGTLTNWGGGIGSASAWRFVQKNDPTKLQEVVVKYSFTYGGVEKYTQESKTLVGEEWPAIATAFPYGVSAVKPAGVIAEADVVEGVANKVVELSNNLPFEPAADYASIENWYYLIFHANQLNYLYYTADGAVLEANKTAVDANDKDAYTWAFVGNPIDGFEVYNKKAGKSLDAAEAGAVVSATEKQVFKLTASTYGTNGFYMQAVDGDKTERFNKQGGKVVYWSGADAGSTFMVELRDDAAALRQLVASANALLESLGEGTIVGCVTAESKAAISNAIDAAEKAFEDEAGYDGAQAALQAAVNGVETIQPEEGKFYTISSAMAETDNRSGQMMYINADSCLQFRPEYNDSAVFQFVAAGEGEFYLLNVKNNTYLSTAKAPGNNTQAEMKAETIEGAKAVVITNMGKSNVVKIVPVGGGMLHAQAAGSKVVAWDNNDPNNASAWIIEECSDPTAIDVVEVQESTIIYDLLGRRVEKMEKGIYIVNGRKVLVK